MTNSSTNRGGITRPFETSSPTSASRVRGLLSLAIAIFGLTLVFNPVAALHAAPPGRQILAPGRGRQRRTGCLLLFLTGRRHRKVRILQYEALILRSRYRGERYCVQCRTSSFTLMNPMPSLDLNAPTGERVHSILRERLRR